MLKTTSVPPNKKMAIDRNDDILIQGARVHNLQNVTVTIPRNKLVVVTGVSGSGKSSLTIDTLFAEGQRRYAESLSAYARQFMQRMNKPDVDYIKGLCPAIAIEQKVITRTPRSTVGSMTELYDYLRLLFARTGKTISPISGREVKKDDVPDVVNAIQQSDDGTKILILALFKSHANRDVKEELNILLQKGFARLYVNNAIVNIEDIIEEGLPKKMKHEAYILIDRLIKKDFDEEDLHRIADSANTAFYEGEGTMFVQLNDDKPLKFSNKFELDGIQFEEPVPNLFSFNNPFGACPTCEGFSQVLGLDEDLILPDKRLSVYEGAVSPWRGEKLGLWKDNFIHNAKKFDFPVHKPIMDLTEKQLKDLWQGNQYTEGINDFFKEVEQNLYKVQYRVLLSRYRGRTLCTDCHGYRLRKEALYVKVGGKHIGELCEIPVKDLQVWFQKLQLSAFDEQVAKRILIEIQHRIKTLIDVGLGYLTLNRLANSLSGGESQRIQLTRSLGSNLTNSLYILDEPSIGLHSRDTEKLIVVLKELRDLGNTVVVVEHDELMMREADHIIDMGPFASHLGGKVVAAGDYDAIIKNKQSLTGQYLSGALTIDVPKVLRKWNESIKIEGAKQNNLKDVTVEFPLHVLCAVSGVSGSGKTTLVKQILYPALQKIKGEPADKPGLYRKISGDIDSVTRLEMIDQNPIGKSSRSNPVTYIKAYDEIRELFANQPLAKIRGFMPKHFSFNVDAGRCDACKGEGEQLVEMQFLADVHLVCDVCNGKRFKEEVLEVQYKGKNIHDVLEMSVDEAITFFVGNAEKSKTTSSDNGADVAKKIQPLSDVGLGYVKLGQSSNTLSGGEAQRVKLASFLGKGKAQGHILFIFDEPTTGLHFHDIKKLLASMNALVEQGHSILVIEHNTDVLKSADWLIDLGPEAGDKGGNVVFAGKPADIKKVKESYTGKFL
ncbi:excinuclease ABC subunit UvrA [Ferruginibacter yonginensis]|uniref:UvrABC system protein A n=1 Tax=Ferruginibacter yonginensis TaxID=1310416 RepID=A0ABV8QWW5_9BACT